MDIFTIISNILENILDLEPSSITPETYVIRDLDAESIDLLEIGVAMEHQLDIPIQDDTLFLTNMRSVLSGMEDQEALQQLEQTYPHLDAERYKQIQKDLDDGPVLKVKDLVAYATFQLQKSA